MLIAFGQKSDAILCYSFLPAEGVENIIRLRARVRQRLQQNAEVVGTDESFFEDDDQDGILLDLYNEKSGILDGDADTEVDLASYAYQIWKNAITANKTLANIIPKPPPVTYATKHHIPYGAQSPAGALVYMRTAEGNDALAWLNEKGKSVSESQYAILKAAECAAASLMTRLPNSPSLCATKTVCASSTKINKTSNRTSSAQWA